MATASTAPRTAAQEPDQLAPGAGGRTGPTRRRVASDPLLLGSEPRIALSIARQLVKVMSIESSVPVQASLRSTPGPRSVVERPLDHRHTHPGRSRSPRSSLRSTVATRAAIVVLGGGEQARLDVGEHQVGPTEHHGTRRRRRRRPHRQCPEALAPLALHGGAAESRDRPPSRRRRRRAPTAPTERRRAPARPGRVAPAGRRGRCRGARTGARAGCDPR